MKFFYVSQGPLLFFRDISWPELPPLPEPQTALYASRLASHLATMIWLFSRRTCSFSSFIPGQLTPGDVAQTSSTPGRLTHKQSAACGATKVKARGASVKTHTQRGTHTHCTHCKHLLLIEINMKTDDRNKHVPFSSHKIKSVCDII